MAKPTERYRVKRSGTTFGRVYREGETFGYTDLPMRNRDKVWELLSDNDKVELVADEANADDAPVVMNLTNNSPSQPQGSPDGPLAGDSPEARAAKEFKNLETAGVVSQAAGLQGGTGADVEAMAEKADAELEFRGEANPDAVVGDFVPEKVSDEPAMEQPSPTRMPAEDEKEDAKTEDKPKGNKKSS